MSLFEEQTYTLQVGKAAALIEAYESRGLAILRRVLGELVAFWVVEAGGDIDTVIQVWRFESAADRFDRRSALLADPEWQAFAGEYGYLITSRNLRLLSAASFSPVQ